MEESNSKKKIAILGGGPAGLAAAFALTEQPDWQDHFDIAIYQQGWRLGGKCASSRNRRVYNRIEEHGIHIFGNFYFNAFDVVRRAYEELGWSVNPVSSMEELFEPENYGLNMEFWEGEWLRWPNPLPAPPLSARPPWGSESALASPSALVLRLIQIAYAILSEASLDSGSLTFLHKRLRWLFRRFWPDGEAALSASLESGPAERSFCLDSAFQARLLRFVVRFHRLLHVLFGAWALEFTRSRRVFFQLDFYCAFLRGILQAEIITRGTDHLDHLDYRSWLSANGCSDHTLDSVVPHIPINVCFQYPHGASFLTPSMSAASYVQFLVRQLLAPGSWLYRFAAGTGEALIAPLYLALKQRGVKFAFFHRVEHLALSEDGSSLARLDLQKQATVKNGMFAYQPLFEDRGWQCWPESPLFEQLEEGEALRSSGADLENFWSAWQGEQVSLHVGQDFDEVILAIPLGALPSVASECSSRRALPFVAERWSHMQAELPAIGTLAFQIWLSPSKEDLGWDSSKMGLSLEDEIISANWSGPASAIADFSSLIPLEGWPEEDRPGFLMYFCGAFPVPDHLQVAEDAGFPLRQAGRARAIAINSLRQSFAAVFPKAGCQLRPWGLDFAHFHSVGSAASPDIFREGLFSRANVQPWDRYITSPPGSSAARLRPEQSGIAGLILAGDWTDTGLNVGSVEGAVISGREAAAILDPRVPAPFGRSFLKALRSIV